MFLPDYAAIEGWLTPAEALALYRLARRLPAHSTTLEIGTWKGKSAYCLARGLRSGRVVVIDPFDGSGDVAYSAEYERHKGSLPLYDQFVQNMQRGRVWSKIEVRRGLSTDWAENVPECQLLFIDGNHSIPTCRFDFEHYSPALALGGYLAFHDYGPAGEHAGPAWVVHNQVLPSGHYQFVGQYDSVWVAQKIAEPSGRTGMSE